MAAIPQWDEELLESLYTQLCQLNEDKCWISEIKINRKYYVAMDKIKLVLCHQWKVICSYLKTVSSNQQSSSNIKSFKIGIIQCTVINCTIKSMKHSDWRVIRHIFGQTHMLHYTEFILTHPWWKTFVEIQEFTLLCNWTHDQQMTIHQA